MLLEYVDVIHFLVTIALIMEWTADDFYEWYLKKNKSNDYTNQVKYPSVSTIYIYHLLLLVCIMASEGLASHWELWGFAQG